MDSHTNLKIKTTSTEAAKTSKDNGEVNGGGGLKTDGSMFNNDCDHHGGLLPSTKLGSSFTNDPCARRDKQISNGHGTQSAKALHSCSQANESTTSREESSTSAKTPCSSFSMDTLLQQKITDTKVDNPSIEPVETAGGAPQASLALSPSIVISKQNTPLSSVLSDEYSIESPLSVGSSGKDEPGKLMRKRDPAEERQRLRNYRLPHHKGLSRASKTTTTTTTTTTTSSATVASSRNGTTTSTTTTTSSIVPAKPSATVKTSLVEPCPDAKVKIASKSDNNNSSKATKPKGATMSMGGTPLAPLKPQPPPPTLLQPASSGHLFNSPIFLPSGPTTFSSFPQSYPFPFLQTIFNNQFFNPINSKPMSGSVVSNPMSSMAGGASTPCSVPSSVPSSRFYHHPHVSSSAQPQSQLTIFTSPPGPGHGAGNTLSPFSFQSPATLLSPTFSPTGLSGPPGSAGTPLLVPKSLNFSPNLAFPNSGTLDPHSLMMFGFANGLQASPSTAKVVPPCSSSSSTGVNVNGQSSTSTSSPPFILPRLHVSNVTSNTHLPAFSGCSTPSRAGKCKDRSNATSVCHNQTLSKPMPMKASLPTFILSNQSSGGPNTLPPPPQHTTPTQSILQPQTLFLLQPPSIPTAPVPKASISEPSSLTTNHAKSKGSKCGSTSAGSSKTTTGSSQKESPVSAYTVSPTSIRTTPTALPGSFILTPPSPHAHHQLPYTLFSPQGSTQALMSPISIQAPPPPPPTSMLGGAPLLLSVISPTNRNAMNNLHYASMANNTSHSPSVFIQSTMNNVPVSVSLPSTTKTIADSKVTSTVKAKPKTCKAKTSTNCVDTSVTSSVSCTTSSIVVTSGVTVVSSTTTTTTVTTSIVAPSTLTSPTPSKSFFSTLNESHFRDCSLSSAFLSPSSRAVPLSSSIYVNSSSSGSKSEKKTALPPEPPSKLISPDASIGIEELQNLVRSVNDNIKSFGPPSDFYDDVDLTSLKHKGEKINVVVVEDDAFSPQRMKPLLQIKDNKDEAKVIKLENHDKKVEVVKTRRKTKEDDDTSDGSRSKKKKSKKHKDRKKDKLRVPTVTPMAQKCKLKKKIAPKVNCIKDPEVLKKVNDIIQIFSTTFKISDQPPRRILPAPLPEMFRVRYVKKTVPDVKMSSKACGSDRHPIKTMAHRNKSDPSTPTTNDQSAQSCQSFLPLKKRQHRNVEEGSNYATCKTPSSVPAVVVCSSGKTMPTTTTTVVPPVSSIDSIIEAVVAAHNIVPEDKKASRRLKNKTNVAKHVSQTDPAPCPDGATVVVQTKAQSAKAEGKTHNISREDCGMTGGSGTARVEQPIKANGELDSGSGTLNHNSVCGAKRVRVLLDSPTPPASLVNCLQQINCTPSLVTAIVDSQSSSPCQRDIASIAEPRTAKHKRAVPVASKQECSLSSVDLILNEVVNNSRTCLSDPSDADDELEGESDNEINMCPRHRALAAHKSQSNKDKKAIINTSQQLDDNVVNHLPSKVSTKKTKQLAPEAKKKRRRRFNRTGFTKQRKRSSSTSKVAASAKVANLPEPKKSKLKTMARHKKSATLSTSSSEDNDCKASKKKKKTPKIVKHDTTSSSEADRRTMSSSPDSSTEDDDEFYKANVFLVTKPTVEVPGLQAHKIRTNTFARPITGKTWETIIVPEETEPPSKKSNKAKKDTNVASSTVPDYVSIMNCNSSKAVAIESLINFTINKQPADWPYGNIEEVPTLQLAKKEDRLTPTRKKCVAIFEDYFQYSLNPFDERAKSANYKRIKQNIIQDVKQSQTHKQVCTCSLPKGNNNGDHLPCGSDCLNRNVFHECDASNCNYKMCANRRIQKSEWSPGLVRILTKLRGWGIRTTQPIQAGSFIMEYIGEVVSEKLFNRRMKERYRHDLHHYSLQMEQGSVIDGYRFANEGRFVNHSCEPNCEIQKWHVNGDNRMCLFALRDIQPNEELFYDYKFMNFNATSTQTCYCQSSKCRGTIGGKPKPSNNNNNIQSLATTFNEKIKHEKEAMVHFKVGGPQRKKPDLPPHDPLSKDFMHFNLKRTKFNVSIKKFHDPRLADLKRKLRNPISNTIMIKCNKKMARACKPLGGRERRQIKRNRVFLVRNFDRIYQLSLIINEENCKENKENNVAENGYSSGESLSSQKRLAYSVMSETNVNTSDSDSQAESSTRKFRTRSGMALANSNIQIFIDICSHVRSTLMDKFGRNVFENGTDPAPNNSISSNGGGRLKRKAASRALFDFASILHQLNTGKLTQYAAFKQAMLDYIKDEFDVIKECPSHVRVNLDTHTLGLVVDDGNRIDWQLVYMCAIESFNVALREKEAAFNEAKLKVSNNMARESNHPFDLRLNRLMGELEREDNNNVALNQTNRKRFDLFSGQLASTEPIELTDLVKATRSVEKLLLEESQSNTDIIIETDISNDDKIRCICGLTRDNILRDMIQCDGCKVWQHDQCVRQVMQFNKNDDYYCEVCSPRDVPKEMKLMSEENEDDSDPMIEQIEEYVNLESPILKKMIRLGDCVYLQRAQLDTLTTEDTEDVTVDGFCERMRLVAKEAIKNFDKQFVKSASLLMRIEKLAITKTTNQKLIYGFLYLWPSETYREPTRRFFPNEVLKSQTYEWAAIEEVRGFCEVMDPDTYRIGRPLNIHPDDLYIVDNVFVESRNVFRKMKKKFPINMANFVFGRYREKLALKRTFLPDADNSQIISTKKSKSKKEEIKFNLFENISKDKTRQKKMINLLKIGNGLHKLAFYQHLIHEQQQSH